MPGHDFRQLTLGKLFAREKEFWRTAEVALVYINAAEWFMSASGI